MWDLRSWLVDHVQDSCKVMTDMSSGCFPDLAEKVTKNTATVTSLKEKCRQSNPTDDDVHIQGCVPQYKNTSKSEEYFSRVQRDIDDMRKPDPDGCLIGGEYQERAKNLR